MLGAVLALAADPADASIRLHLTIGVQHGETAATVECEVRNVGSRAAWDLVAEGWRLDGVRSLAAVLEPGATAKAAWSVPLADWRSEVRELAAIRIRYRDVDHHPASIVHVHGAAATNVRARAPRWPHDPVARLDWTEPPAEPVTVEWWSPDQIGVEAPGRWAPDEPLEARVFERADVTGWRTSAHALLLPEGGGPGLVLEVPLRFDGWRAVWRPDGWVLAACLAGALLVALAVATFRRGRASERRPFPARLVATLPLAVLVAVFAGVLLTAFPPRLLLLDVTPAGGDFGSHVFAAQRMRDVLLPSGRLCAWEMGQYGGFPLFLFYFPLAFVVVALLGWLLPIGVALKVGSLAGVVVLPAAWALAARWLGGSRWTATCAAAGSAWLLLLETQQVWGGNIPSLLAGEFAYALGFPLAWLAMARAHRGRDGERLTWHVPVLLALTALAHGYALVAAASGILLLLVAPRRFHVRAWMVARWGLLGFGLCAFFLVPLAWGLPHVNGFRELWRFDVARELVPPILWPAAALAAVALVRTVVASWRSRRGEGGAATGAATGVARGIAPAWLFAFGALMLLTWRVGYSLGVVDIRFLPFFHGALILAAAFELGRGLDRLRDGWRAPAAALAVAVIAFSAVVHVRSIPTWARWNLSGMETKEPWPHFAATMDAVRGRVGQARVAFEHHPDHDRIGTIRAFELIPHFSGRATLEGLYMQAAPLAPAAFHVQSLLSLHPSCPLGDFECDTFEPAKGVAELRLLGADSLITYTDEMDAALAPLPGVQLSEPMGAYRVARLVPETRIVEAASFEPVVDRAATRGDWRHEGYAWLRAGTDHEVPLLLEDAQGPASVDRYEPGKLPRLPLPTPPEHAVIVSRETIEIRSARPGHPFVVKVAWHPGWRASDGSRIWRIAPAFMLVVPRTEHVRLEWSTGAAGVLGHVLTLAAIAVLLALPLVRRRWRWEPPRDAGRAGTIAVAAGCAFAGALVVVACVRHPPMERAQMVADAARMRDGGDVDGAERLLERALAGREAHPARDDARANLALCAEAGGDAAEARRRWEAFLDDFPVSRWRAEALVRLSRLVRADGDAATASDRLVEALEDPLAPPDWRQAARDEMAQHP